MAKLIKIIGCDNSSRLGDVVFVHGLGGDGLGTWHAAPPKKIDESDPKTLEFWPKWLGEERDDLGIWSLDYELGRTDWFEETMPLAVRADNALELFANDEIGQKPVVFICHSMGGLLTKQLLRNALDIGDEDQRAIAENTKGIVFLATPHAGAKWSNWIQFVNDRLQNLLRLSISVKELEYGHSRLQELNGVYRKRDVLDAIPVKAYYETVPLKPFGVIVDKISADMGKGELPTPVGKNHLNICKLTLQDKKTGVVYKSVLRFLKSCLPPAVAPSSKQANSMDGETLLPPQPSSVLNPFGVLENLPPSPPLKLSDNSPFGDLGRINSSRFFGRELLLRQIIDSLRQGSSVSLVGEHQIGKSSILDMVMEQGPGALEVSPDRFVLLSLQWLKGEEDFFQLLWRKLGIDPTLQSWQLWDELENKRFVVCLDEMNRMKDHAKFTREARDWLKGFADGAEAPLTLVIASTQPLKQLFDDDPDSSSTLDGICRQLWVKPFSEKETYRFLQTRLVQNVVQFTGDDMATLYQETQGYPAMLQAEAEKLYNQRKQQLGR